MKVLLIVSSYAPNVGGLQNVTRQLARELNKRGHDVVVLTNRYPRTLAVREVFDEVPVVRWHFLAPRLQQLLSLRLDLFLAGILYLPLTLAHLVFWLRRERPDVVNLHFVGSPALFVLLACWFASFRLVVSVHGDDVQGFSRRARFDRWLFHSLLRRADVVTACSRYLLDQAASIDQGARQKGRVIHNGLDQLSDVSEISKKGGLVTAGRMVAGKGFDVLVEAMARGKTESRLTLIGDGPEREKLKARARNLGLNGEIRFAGQQDRVRVLEEMAAADLVVIPSREESFSLVALEAMTLGKPVVATCVGGLPEILEGADALLVQPGDSTELAEAIVTVRERLHSDPEFGARNRACAAHFSSERMTDGYLEAYRA